jgi:hypothetical protein
MKYLFNRLVVALLLVILASASTFAKVHKATITLKSDTRIGEVLVEKGTYQVKFDDEGSELSIWKGRKQIAKSAVQLQPRPKAVDGTEHMVILENDETKLVSVTFSGSHQTLVLKPSATQATINK